MKAAALAAAALLVLPAAAKDKPKVAHPPGSLCARLAEWVRDNGGEAAAERRALQMNVSQHVITLAKAYCQK